MTAIRSDRRRKIRRRFEHRLLKIIFGECDDVTWSIDPHGDSQKPVACGKCLPCRVRARFDIRTLDEILDDLESRRDQRVVLDRRRAVILRLIERRKNGARRR